MQYSDDPGSKQRGGDIGFYDRDRLRPDIVALLFDLPADSIPPPYRQPYGFHIFKVLGHRPLAPYAEMEKDLQAQYQQLSYQSDLANYIDGLKHRYNLTINTPVQEELRVSFDTTKTPNDSAWSQTVPAGLFPKTLFTCAGEGFSVKEFVDSIGTEVEFQGTLLKPVNIDAMATRLANARVLRAHAQTATDRYPELKALMDEYLEGILLYRVEQDEVWKKVVVNDSLLRIFYDSTKSNYQWSSRVDFAEIFVTSDSVKRVVEQALGQGEEFLTVAQENTARAGFRDKLGIWGYQPYNLNELTQKASAMEIGAVSGFFPEQNGWSTIKVLGKDSARTKSFEEAGPELASAYQEQASKVREQEWIESLEHKYGVTLHSDVLMQAFKRKPVGQN
jgi:parvulin-like peptidyl-prolyl isomerase